MKKKLIVLLFIAIAGVLLVREQDTGTFTQFNEWLLDTIEDATPKQTSPAAVTIIRHDEESADISGSIQLTEVDMALFLRTALKFSPVSIGIAGDLTSKEENPLIADILGKQSQRNAHVCFGLLFSSESERQTPKFRTLKQIDEKALLPLRFLGIPFPTHIPANATVGFLNIDEKMARRNLIPLIGAYRDKPFPSFSLAMLMASGLLPNTASITPGSILTLQNGNSLKINTSGFYKIRENMRTYIQSVTLDELLLEMEKFESGKKSEKLQTLLSNRIILLGRDGEADKTIPLASEKKYSALYIQALGIASMITGKAILDISTYWNFCMLALVAIPLFFCSGVGCRLLFCFFLFAIPIAIAVGLRLACGLWFPLIPSLGMVVCFAISLFFLTSQSSEEVGSPSQG